MKTITAPDRQYFYHPDLPIFIGMGSPAFLTDADGEAHQHMQYLPFGETFIDQRIDWNPRFTFTDKEKDKNTGYHYFGARYYDSEVSVFISVDQLSDERQGLSPYNYVQWNPLNRVDPTGMLDTKYEDETGKLLAETNDGNDATVVISDENKEKFLNEYNTSKERGAADARHNNRRWIGYGLGMKAEGGEFVPDWALDATNPESRGELLGSDNASRESGGFRVNPGGPILIILGQKLLPKRGGVGGGGNAGKATSIASKTLRWVDKTAQGLLKTNAKLPAKNFLARMLRTRGLGAAAGRAVPVLGWIWTGADVGWEAGKIWGPSTWFGDDDNKWFE